MNCVQLLFEQAKLQPQKKAIWMPNSWEVSFAQLIQNACRIQKSINKYNVKPNDSVLLLEPLTPHLYSAICGLMALGIKVILVEPWMPITHIDHVIKLTQPKLFISHWLGRIWGMRVPQVRKIPHWTSLNSLLQETNPDKLQIEQVEPNQQGIITFTSGTTGKPKGVVRSHNYLMALNEVLGKALEMQSFTGSDLCIFANFALLNLAAGKTTLVMPQGWKKKHLLALSNLPQELQPQTLTCGPAFLEKLMLINPIQNLKSIHVGGALTDCALWEQGFKAWPMAHWSHVYGSSEAEPVCISDGKQSVRLSQKRGYFQNISLGFPVSALNYQIEPSGLWISGPHVCPQYIGNDEENKINKRLDEHGKLWHFMGDQIISDPEGFWYAGKSNQNTEDFTLEQKVYSLLRSSRNFIYRDASQKIFLCGENLKTHQNRVAQNFPEICKIVELKIYRDKRHLARIDRHKSILKGAKWLMQK